MARKPSSAKYKEDVKRLRNPELVDSDTVAMSSHVLKQTIAVNSNIKKWTLNQQLLFIIALGRIKDWRTGGNNNVVVLNNYDVMKELGWDYNRKDLRKVSYLLHKEFDAMVKNCAISIYDPHTGIWDSANLISRAKGNTQTTTVIFNPDVMPHFEDLFRNAKVFKQPFCSLLEPDITSFTRKHSYYLYTDFKMKCQVTNTPVVKTISYRTEDLLALLDIDIDAYSRGNNTNKKGEKRFNHTNFEKKVLIPVIEEINETESMEIGTKDEETGNIISLYKKIKENRRVVGYSFDVTVYDSNSIKEKRLLLYNMAKEAGVDPQFFPSLKEMLPIESYQKNTWDIAAQPVVKPFEGNGVRRNDKQTLKAKELFDLPDALKDFAEGNMKEKMRVERKIIDANYVEISEN